MRLDTKWELQRFHIGLRIWATALKSRSLDPDDGGVVSTRYATSAADGNFLHLDERRVLSLFISAFIAFTKEKMAVTFIHPPHLL